MCKPLRGKAKKVYDEIWQFDYDDVKSAVIFYKRYVPKNDNSLPQIGLLKRDEKEAYKHYLEYNHLYKRYIDWLFDYCFQDVI